MSIGLDCVKLLLLNAWRRQDEKKKKRSSLIGRLCNTQENQHTEAKEKEQVKAGAR